MLTIACVKWGSRYGASYVNILADMCRRNLPEGFEGKFVCFTDDADGIDPSIECRSLSAKDLGVVGWWNKLWLFSRDAFDDGERVLYFDLDTLVISDLDEIVTYAGRFGILNDPYHPSHYNSSCMMWTAGEHCHVWDNWISEGKPELPLGDQQWIESQIHGADFFQTVFPGSFQSYKVHCYPFPTMGTKVVYFHGEPKPHTCGAAWVEKIWKIGGDSSYELKLLPNQPVEAILANIRENIKLDREWIYGEGAHEGVAVIVGSGPSLLDSIDDIRARSRSGQTVFALNGAARVLLDHGIEPDYQVILDSRVHNVEFLVEGTQALLASQTHPMLVAAAGPSAILWHPGIEGIDDILAPTGKDYALIGGGTTVGLCSMCLVYAMGFRNLHLFGYDSSYRNDALHAVPQFSNANEYRMTITVNAGVFETTAAMAQQAKRWPELALELAERGCVISVHGDGLLPSIAKEIASMQFRTAADDRAAEIFSRLPRDRDVLGAEIGVYQGTLSTRLLQHDRLKLYLVDRWQESAPDSSYSKSGDGLATVSQDCWDDTYQRVLALTEYARDRVEIIRGDSADSASKVEDGSLDFVFIDADHSYEGCDRDIKAWYSKVRDGGLFCGHDYDHSEYPQWGVKRAVDEFALTHGLKVELGADYTWFITKPLAHEMAA